LDVGDASGYLLAFDDDLDVISADVELYGEPLPGARRLLADGAALPFADNSFDAVISSDALEHVAPDSRNAFLMEFTRVSRGLVAVAAPFDTPGVGGAEELVRRYAQLTTGRPQAQLEEHRDYGLPDLPRTVDCLREAGLEVSSQGNGNLHDWVSMMLLKHQLMPRTALAPLDGGYDIAYNYLFAQRAHAAPFYRHVVAGRQGQQPVWAPQVGEGSATDAPVLLASFLSANITEVVRQDVVPALQEHDRALAAMHSAVAAQLDALDSATAARLDLIAVRVDELTQTQSRLTEAHLRGGAGTRVLRRVEHAARQMRARNDRTG